MSTPGSYSLNLSPPELFWLLSVFGKRAQAFLGNPFEGPPADRVTRQIQSGGASLVARGLVHPDNGVWQVESLLAALTDLLTDPARLIQIEKIEHSGKRVVFNICAEASLYLLVQKLPAEYALTVFPNSESLLLNLVPLLGLKENPDVQDNPAAINIPDPEYFIPLAWKNPEVAKSALARLNRPPVVDQDCLNWVKNLSGLIIFKNQAGDKIFIVASNTSTWAGKFEEPLEFRSSKLFDIRELLTELFK
jgi:hypothetical protein